MSRLITLLVVTDCDGLFDLVQRELRWQGHHILRARSPCEAVETTRVWGHYIQATIVHWTLPLDVANDTVVADLQTADPGARVLVLTHLPLAQVRKSIPEKPSVLLLDHLRPPGTLDAALERLCPRVAHTG